MTKISVGLNENLEFVNSVLLTSRYNEVTKPFIGYGLMAEEDTEYIRRIKAHFRRFQNAPIYHEIERMIPNGFTFSRPVELALSLSASRDFTIRRSLSDLCVRYCGGMENIAKLLGLLRDFAAETNYFDFYESAKHYYNESLLKMDDFVRAYQFTETLEAIYGRKQNSYQLVLSSLMVGCFGISFQNGENRSFDLFSVINSYDTDNDVNRALLTNLLFHEFSHPFINPLTEQYHSKVEGYSGAYELLNEYRLPDYRSGYGDWTECVNEHFVRAIAIYCMRKCNLQAWADDRLNDDLQKGYLYIPAILERYNYYESNRMRYPTFDEFYPELLDVFQDIIL